jgi:hypothetical protein
LQSAHASSASSASQGGRSLNDAELSVLAIARLTADPPPEVGSMQQHTSKKLLRPYPLG